MTDKRMPLTESLRLLHAARSDEVIITTMSAAREWSHLPPHPLDFIYLPSSMGQASSLGLGVALAKPHQRVVVCNGDGCTLMNLGSLVSITAAAPRNLILLVFDNEVYELTGGQGTAASRHRRANKTSLDYAEMARACGFRSIHVIESLPQWETTLPTLLTEEGPVFAWLKVAPMPDAGGAQSPGPAAARARAFAEALQAQA